MFINKFNNTILYKYNKESINYMKNFVVDKKCFNHGLVTMFIFPILKNLKYPIPDIECIFLNSKEMFFCFDKTTLINNNIYKFNIISYEEEKYLEENFDIIINQRHTININSQECLYYVNLKGFSKYKKMLQNNILPPKFQMQKMDTIFNCNFEEKFIREKTLIDIKECIC